MYLQTLAIFKAHLQNVCEREREGEREFTQYNTVGVKGKWSRYIDVTKYEYCLVLLNAPDFNELSNYLK